MTSVSIAAGVHSVLLAADQQPQGPEFGKASPLGLLIIILLLICTALLIWSMNRQLRKLPKTFDTEHPEADQPSTRHRFGWPHDAAVAGRRERHR